MRQGITISHMRYIVIDNHATRFDWVIGSRSEKISSREYLNREIIRNFPRQRIGRISESRENSFDFAFEPHKPRRRCATIPPLKGKTLPFPSNRNSTVSRLTAGTRAKNFANGGKLTREYARTHSQNRYFLRVFTKGDCTCFVAKCEF